MSNFGVDAAQLVALFMESAAWGMQCVTVTMCIYTLVSKSRDSKRPVNRSLLAYALVLFALGTIDIGLAVYRNLQAFVYYQGQGGATAIFGQISDYVTVLRSGCDFLAVLVADSALIYRCYVVYGRRWVVIIPSSVLWLACFACAIAETYYSSTASQPTDLVGAAKIEPFLNAFIVCCVVLNIITTGLILYRINSIHRASARYFSEASGGTTVSNRLRWSELSRILIESAFIYTLSGVILLIVNFAGSNAVYPTSDINMQIAGIQFDLILIRVGRGIAAEHVEARTSMQTMQFNLRALDPAVQVQRPAMQITVTHDTSASTELRSPYSDVESKSLRGSKPDLVGIRSIRLAGSDDDLHYL